MSMLADRRKKANWVLNPRNTHWTADTSKYGLRLMEKMGWTEGSGLGANMQGSTEHIKVAVRSDNRGVGFKDRPEDELVHQADFSDLLQQLASETPPLEGPVDENKSARIASLEEKSQMSRSRVHYKKFTRGKDLSRYSEKDLANIIGKPAYLTSVKNTTSVEERNEPKFESDVNTVKGGDMYSYFKKKMSGNGLMDRREEPSELEEIGTKNGMSEMDGPDDNFVEINVGKKEKKAKRVSKESSDADTESDAEARKERKRRRKAQKQLKLAEEVIEYDNTNDLTNEKGTDSKLELESASKGCEDAVECAADGAETKKERKQKRRAERALKNSERQLELEGVAGVVINIENNDVNEIKLKLNSVGEENEQVVEDDKTVLAENKKEKKRLKKVQKALKRSQQQTELEIITNSVGKAKNKDIHFLACKGTEQAEENAKPLEKRKRKRNNIKMPCDEARSAENGFEMFAESEATDLGAEVTQMKKAKKSRKELDTGSANLEEQNDEANDPRIKNKKKQRKSEDLLDRKQKKEFLNTGQEGNVENDSIVENESFKKEGKRKKKKTVEKQEISADNIKLDSISAEINMEKASVEFHSEEAAIGLSNLQEEETDMPVATQFGNPEFFCDSRSKKVKKKSKQQNLKEPSQQPELESSSNSVSILKMDIEHPNHLKNEKVLEQNYRKAQNSQTMEEEAIIVNGNIECEVEMKKDRKRKRNGEGISGVKTLTETVDGSKSDIECNGEKRKDKKRKRKDKETANFSVEETLGVPAENTEMTKEIFSKGQNNVVKNVVNHEELQKDIVGAEKVVALNAVGAELNIQGNVLVNKIDVSCKRGTEADEPAKAMPSKENEQILSCGSSTTVTEGTDCTENDCTSKKPISIVKLNGKVYMNGICNFDLPSPAITNVELKKIPVHLRKEVKFLPISGANVQQFGYVGLQFSKI